MTFPITPNPAIHVQPAGIGAQQMLYSGGQLQAWAQSLPLAMTLKLMDAILKALGVSQSTIDAYNNDATTYYDAVQTELGTVNTDVAALQADSTASEAAFATLLTSWEAAITGYTSWSTFITALETAWTTYSTTESGLSSGAIFTLQNLFNTLLGISPTTGQMTPTNIGNVLGGSSLGSDVTSVNTQATTQNAWWGRWMTDVSIYLDLFHTTYPVGSPSDGPTTTISGVRTWYSAIADILALFGVVHSTSAPSNPVSDVGTTASAASAAATTAGTNASIAISSASAANTLAQGTIDGLNTAWSAGGTGNPVTTIPTIAAAIPTSAIVGGAGATVTFGAAGAGNNAGNLFGATSSSLSWSHTIATGDLGVLVFIGYVVSPGQTASSSVTYGGTAMTMIQKETSSASSGLGVGVLEAWWLKSPASGAKTVAVSVSGANFSQLMGNSVSYVASKVGTVGPNLGGGSDTLSMSAASVTGNMVVGAFCAEISSGSQSLSAYTQTQRYNASSGGGAVVIGDAAGASSVSFGATSSASGGGTNLQWAGITVELEN